MMSVVVTVMASGSDWVVRSLAIGDIQLRMKRPFDRTARVSGKPVHRRLMTQRFDPKRPCRRLDGRHPPTICS